MTPAWTLRPAIAADLPYLLELRVATMAPQFARQGIVLSADEHCRRAEFRLDAANLIEVDGQPAGLVKLLKDGATWTIEQFQIAAGAARAAASAPSVLRAVIAEARHANALLHLSVLKKNPAARLYARLGFRTLAESVHSYKMTFIDGEAHAGECVRAERAGQRSSDPASAPARRSAASATARGRNASAMSGRRASARSALASASAWRPRPFNASARLACAVASVGRTSTARSSNGNASSGRAACRCATARKCRLSNCSGCARRICA